LTDIAGTKKKLLPRNKEKAHSIPAASEVKAINECSAGKKNPNRSTLLQNGISDLWFRTEEKHFVSVPQLQLG